MRLALRRAFASGALVVLHSTSSLAQPNWGDKAVAKQLFEDAEKLMAAGNAAAACPKYDESQRRAPELDTLLKLADCYEKAGKAASAWAAFSEAAELAARKGAAGAREPREQTARARAAALEPKLSRLTYNVIGEGTTGLELRQDGVPVGRGVWGSAVPVDPGSYTVKATAPGKRAWTQVVEVGTNGARMEVLIPPLEDEPVAATAMPAAAPSAPMPLDASASSALPASSSWGVQRTMGVAFAGAGVVSLGVGLVFALNKSSKVSERDGICPSGVHCSPAEADRIAALTTAARADAAGTWIALGIGATAAISGAALILTAPTMRAQGIAAVRFSPWVGIAGAGVSAVGVW